MSGEQFKAPTSVDAFGNYPVLRVIIEKFDDENK